MEGRACVRGMRISAALVVNLIANGMTRDELRQNYPVLEDEDITQCLRYAALMANESISPFDPTGLAISH